MSVQNLKIPPAALYMTPDRLYAQCLTTLATGRPHLHTFHLLIRNQRVLKLVDYHP